MKFHLTLALTIFSKILLAQFHATDSDSIDSNQNSQQYYFLVQDALDADPDRLDTLKVTYNVPEYKIVWKGEPLAIEWSYEPISTAIAPLTIFGCNNLFLLKANQGEGCPTVYRLLQIKGDGHWLSDYFGNCNEIAKISIGTEEIEFRFEPQVETRRTRETYRFYKNRYKVEKRNISASLAK
jgi:hypothetical protein